jgi:phage baseplate assembly protein gpV
MIDELAHQIKHASQQQSGDYWPFVFGHIATYDPTQGVRLIVPSWRDEAGNPVLTNWMPLGSSFAGNGWGVQVAPMGGATFENPTGGEQCIIAVMNQEQGLKAVLCGAFNQVNTVPFSDLNPGEIGIMAESGSFMRFHEDNSVELNTENSDGAINFNCGSGNVAVNTTGMVAVTAPSVQIGNGGALQPVLLADMSPSTVLEAE